MHLGKIQVVAGAEFGMLVRTKAFIITLLLMPVLMVGSIVVERVVAKQVDKTPRRFSVIDPSGVVFPELKSRTEKRNLIPVNQAPFYPELVSGDGDEARLRESERVRKEELFAFVEIPADVLDPQATGRVRYFSDHPSYEDLRQWVEAITNDIVRERRLRAAGLDPETVARLDQKVRSEHLGLFARGPHGEVVPAAKVDVIATFVMPIALMYILFLALFMTAPQLLNAVMQEKMSKISEVLLGSVSPFEIMMGKLVGGGIVSMVLAGVYLGGAIAVASHWGYGNLLTPTLLLYFVLFMALGVLLYGALFIAVGAACNDLKDAQSLMTPMMLVIVMPLLALNAVIKSPGSAFSMAVSLFPPATPFMMLLRLALRPGPAAWEVALGVVLTTGLMLVCVWAAGKIFRVGILSQGKSASLIQMVKWTRAK